MVAMENIDTLGLILTFSVRGGLTFIAGSLNIRCSCVILRGKVN